MNICVAGAGAWGTALANLLCQNGHHVTLWVHDTSRLEELRQTRINQRYLPDILLPANLSVTGQLPEAAKNCECLVLAVPSKAFRQVTSQLPNFSGVAVSVTKGIEYDTGLTMSGILEQTMPRATAAALSGPTLAFEVARDVPAAAVVACAKADVAQKVQSLFTRPTFRVYSSTDLAGVELGGAIKNVIAIAAGVSDGIGLGDNAKAALVTRAIVEIRRLGVACGANGETFAGLSGLGDLVVTCFSKLSRNRAFGERIGRGEAIGQILSSSVTVAEGYPTARSAFQLARKLSVETPILDEVHALLYEGKHAREAVHDLMARDSKPEV